MINTNKRHAMEEDLIYMGEGMWCTEEEADDMWDDGDEEDEDDE